MISPHEQKRVFRQHCREQRDNISLPEWKLWGEKMAEILLKTELWRSCDAVFCFVSMPNEPNTLPLLQAALSQKKRLLVPKIIGDGVMQAVEIARIEELESSVMGILEPLNSEKTVDFSEIDLALIPCLCASEDGVRLGKGGGYYDRFAEQFHGTSVVMCADAFLFPCGAIPTEAHDAKVDYILTEKMLFEAK